MKKPLSSHPAVAAAESDLVKLCREFENLKRQITTNKETIASSIDALNAAEIEHNMIRNRHHGILADIERSTRVTEAKLSGVRELMNNILGPSHNGPVNTCGAQQIDSVRRR